MLAFVTGASSGIGRDIARELAKRGYDLIITARNEQKLSELKNELERKYDIFVRVIIADLNKEKEVFELYKKIKNEKIDVFINNAGIGCVGEFWNTELNTEIEMLKVNNLAMHILFKLILKKMLCERNNKKKYILNVASLSGFMPGPRMSAYYATKAYTLNLTQGVYKELKMHNLDKNVSVSVLCPGPVYTNFCDRANVEFKTKYLSSKYTAQYAINNLFAEKLIIIPGLLNKCGHILGKVLPSKIIMLVIYRIQNVKNKTNKKAALI